MKEVRARKDKLQEALDEGRAVVSESTLRANLSDAEILEQRKREEEAAKLMAEFLAGTFFFLKKGPFVVTLY